MEKGVRTLFERMLYFGLKSLKMEMMYSHCRGRGLCHLRVWTGLEFLLLDVGSVFARKLKEHLLRALLPLLEPVEEHRF